MKKLKIFLGAYVNFPNAQNINCEHIARYLDKNRFEVHTLYTPKMPIDRAYYRERDIRLHRLWHRRFVWFWSKVLIMLLADCDVYYLPKLEAPDRFFAKLVKGKKQLVASVEGVVTDVTNNEPEYRSYFTEQMDAYFAISKYIAESIKEKWGDEVPVLPLGVEGITAERAISAQIRSVIWVGNIKANKRPQWFVEIARENPSLVFTMLGDGDMMDSLDPPANLSMPGRVTNSEVYQQMQRHDLLLMTSEYEGLPKVIQEAALCSVPSIYIAENYTVDFIQDGVNGYGVADLDEMKRTLRMLLDEPERYKQMAAKARESIQPYLWTNLIEQYEEYFARLAEENEHE